MPPSIADVRVPGTTSNLGPGFDTLGIALSVYNRIRVSRASHPGIAITSPLSDDARPGATAVVRDAARLFFRRTRQRPFGFDIHLSGNVPIARGLGSSVTVRLGTVAGLAALTAAEVDRNDLFAWVAELEGHPDNAAPATFGAFTAAVLMRGRARCIRLPVDRRWRFVTLIPPFEVSTSEARRLLPQQFTREDAVHNISRTALIVAAFARGDADRLRGAFEDRLHQPYREPLIPALPRVIRAGERAGAVGGWLSGSGSTIICLALDNVEAVASAMQSVLPGAGVRILRADPGGYRVQTRAGNPSGGDG